jgi:DNA-3-methyladenine glycosylase I
MSDAELEALRENPEIIRNRLKVEAAIENARRIQGLRATHGSFAGWLRAHHPRPKAEWVKLFRSTFRFTGGEIVGEFLMSLGYLPGAHVEDCPAFARVAALDPPWMVAVRDGFNGY